MKIPVIEKNAQEDAIWQYFKSSNTFYESRDVVAPLRKHRLCDNQKTAYTQFFYKKPFIRNHPLKFQNRIRNYPLKF